MVSPALLAVTPHEVPALLLIDNWSPTMAQFAEPAVVTANVTAPPPDPPVVVNVRFPDPYVFVSGESMLRGAWSAWVGVTLADGADGAESPISFVAVIVTV